MKFVIAILLMALLALPASATGMPSQAALDAATAMAAMHNAVMRDVVHGDNEFTELSGADSIYALYSDTDSNCFLMISFETDSKERAETAVVQAYSFAEFEGDCMDSLCSLYIPFMPDDEYDAFDEWRSKTLDGVCNAYNAGSDYELDYYYGEYAACAMSMYHDGGKTLFTALVQWYDPLSADDINVIMEE